MEGDTPSFLHLIARGLSDPEHPEWGSWGGRYGKVAPQYGLYANAIDRVIGVDGTFYKNNQATVWRWRKAFQDDFAARIAWSLAPRYKDTNHAPIAVLNGDKSLQPVRIAAKYGEKIALSAEGSRDPDKNALTYKWWVYDEAGRRDIKPDLAAADPVHATLTVPPPASNLGPGEVHVILEVWDNGTPALVGYRRAVITLTP